MTAPADTTIHSALRHQAGAVIMGLEGHIDHLTAEGFMVNLKSLLASTDNPHQAVILDFSKLVFISSAGLRVLIVAAQDAKKLGRKLAVAGAQPMVQEVFSISRLQLIMPCYLDVAAACEALA